MDKPIIRKPGFGSDFHDSSLINIEISPLLDAISIVVSTPDEYGIEHLWLIEFKGILHVEFETLGNGYKVNKNTPLEIYEIYEDPSSSEYDRWVRRFRTLGIASKEAKNIKHIVLASSFMRGWGDREYLEGINIVCCEINIKSAPPKFESKQFSRPRIETENEA